MLCMAEIGWCELHPYEFNHNSYRWIRFDEKDTPSSLLDVVRQTKRIVQGHVTYFLTAILYEILFHLIIIIFKRSRSRGFGTKFEHCM